MSDDDQPKKTEREKAIEYVKSKLGLNDEELHDKLLETLEYSYAATILSVAYIKLARRDSLESGGQKFGIHEYLQLYGEKKANKTSANANSNPKTEAKCTTLQISLDAIALKECGQEARDICRLLAYLAPGKSIPLSLFKGLPGIISVETQCVDRALKLLTLYGICSIRSGEELRAIDKSFQDVIRKAFDSSEELIMEFGLNLIDQTELNERSVPHAISLWNQASNNSYLVKRYHYLTPRILSVPIYDFELVKNFATRQLKVLWDHLSWDDPFVSKMMIATRALFQYNPDYDSKAGRLLTFREILDSPMVIRFSCPEYILRARARVAVDILRHGRQGEALEILQSVEGACKHEIISQMRGSFVLALRGQTVVLRCNLGLVSPQYCLAVVKGVIEQMEFLTNFEPDDDVTLYFKSDAVNLLFKAGDHDLAYKVSKYSCKFMRTKWSPNDHRLMRFKKVIGLVLAERGNYTESIKTLTEVLDKQSKVLGSQHQESKDTQVLLDSTKAKSHK